MTEQEKINMFEESTHIVPSKYGLLNNLFHEYIMTLTEEERRKALPNYAERQDLLEYYKKQDEINSKKHNTLNL